MPEISKITLPNGTTYDIKDAVARTTLAGAILLRGRSITALTDGSTTSPINIGELLTSKPGDWSTKYNTYYVYNTTSKHFEANTSSTWADNTYYKSVSLTPDNANAVLYENMEFVWTSQAGETGVWYEFGKGDALGAFAYVDEGQVTITPKGSVSQPTFSGTQGSVSFTIASSDTGNYTPAGSVSQPTFSGTAFTSTGSYTPAGSVSQPTFSGNANGDAVSFTITETDSGSNHQPKGSISFTNGNKTATVSAAGSGDATYTPAGSVSQPTFSGTAFTSTGSYTPAGSVSSEFSGTQGSVTFTIASDSNGNYTPGGSISFTNSDKTATVSAAGSGDATYTPAGSVTAPTISVATAGATTTIKNPTSKTVVTDVGTSNTTGTEIAYINTTITNETLVFNKIYKSTGASITTSNVTVKTGDAAYSASAPTFSGTGVCLVTENISVPTSATFTGTKVKISGTYTPAGSVSSEFTGTAATISVSGTATGTVSKPTFTGTGARLVTGNISVPTSATFTGTKVKIAGTVIPTGTVSKPTFSGTAATISVSGTPTGTVSKPTFSGTKVNISGTVTPSGTVSKPTFSGTTEAYTVYPKTN